MRLVFELQEDSKTHLPFWMGTVIHENEILYQGHSKTFGLTDKLTIRERFTDVTEGVLNELAKFGGVNQKVVRHMLINNPPITELLNR